MRWPRASEATWNRRWARRPRHDLFKEIGNQPEFDEEIWQYINRRVSDWRIIAATGFKQNAALFARIEKDLGSSAARCWRLGRRVGLRRYMVQQNHMRPVFPSLSALA